MDVLVPTVTKAAETTRADLVAVDEVEEAAGAAEVPDMAVSVVTKMMALVGAEEMEGDWASWAWMGATNGAPR